MTDQKLMSMTLDDLTFWGQVQLEEERMAAAAKKAEEERKCQEARTKAWAPVIESAKRILPEVLHPYITPDEYLPEHGSANLLIKIPGYGPIRMHLIFDKAWLPAEKDPFYPGNNFYAPYAERFATEDGPGFYWGSGYATNEIDKALAVAKDEHEKLQALLAEVEEKLQAPAATVEAAALSGRKVITFDDLHQMIDHLENRLLGDNPPDNGYASAMAQLIIARVLAFLAEGFR